VAALDAWLCFEDEAGFSMTPPTARTWARRGRTPVTRVRGRSQRRFSIAALACYKHGERSRLIYRPKQHLDHKRGGRRSFTWTDYRDLLIATHQQLGAPNVLVRDNLNVHKDRRLRELINTRLDHLLLPAGLRTRPQPRRGHLVTAATQQPGQHRLHRPRPPHQHAPTRSPPDPVPQQPHNGCLAETGLTLTTSRRQRQ
jgi:hypothetical protein